MNIDNGCPKKKRLWPFFGPVLFFVPPIFFLGLVVLSLTLGKNPSEAFGPRTDFYLYFLPLSELGFDMMANGEPPLWNPFIFCGMPLISSIELGFFYPPNWIHFFVPVHVAFNILSGMHVVIAFGATAVYCRNRKFSASAALMSAACYGFSSALALHLWAGHMAIVYSIAWFPVILFCVDKVLEKATLTRLLILVWVSAFQFLAGFPMFTLATGLILLPYIFVFKKDPENGWRPGGYPHFLVLLAGAGAIYLLLVSVQLIPTLEFIQYSHRGILDYETATTASFPFRNLVTFLFPKFFGDGITIPYWGEFFIWEGVGYCGVVALIFSIIALLDYRRRFVVFWGVVGLAAVGIGLGKYSWVYDFAYFAVPGLNIFRGVGKFIFFAIFSIAVLAGHGLDRVLESDWRTSDKKLRLAIIGFLIIGAIGIVICLMGFLIARQPAVFFEAFKQMAGNFLRHFFDFTPPLSLSVFSSLMSGLLASSLTCFTVGLSLLRLRFTTWRNVRVLPLIILSILALELYHHNFQYFQRSKALPINTLNTEASRVLSADRSLWRISAMVSTMEFLNRFVHERIHDVGGYENAILTRYDAFLKRLFGVESSWHNIHLKVPYNEAVYDMLNVKYVIYEPRDTQGKNDILRQDGDQEVIEYRIRKRDRTLDRAYISHRALCVNSFQEALYYLPQIIAPDAKVDGIVESGMFLKTEPVSEIERSREFTEIVFYSPNEMIIETRLVKPGFLIVSDIFYPGWKAWVDKETSPIFAANVCLRAVYLEAGQHIVRLAFRPESFFIGATASVFGIMLTVVLAVFAITRSRKNNSQPTETPL